MAQKEIDTRTRLAYERTRLGFERTMQAWIRTAASLITFGFSVYKFFQLERPPGLRAHFVLGSREFAIILVALGLLSLFLATLQYHAGIRSLGAEYRVGKTRSLAVSLSAMLTLLGVVALYAIIARE